MKKAVILVSGGLDSATVLAMAQAEGFACHALSFSYGQRHKTELHAATRVAKMAGVAEHRVIAMDLGAFKGSALTDTTTAIPKSRTAEEISHGIPVTYVPARNLIFLSFAVAWAEVLQAEDVFIGVNALDYSGYPDCRPDFVDSFEETANLATAMGTEAKKRIKIHAPLIRMSKADIIRLGLKLGVNYGATASCYDPDPEGKACGQCDSCQLRLKGFREVGIPDPGVYREAV
jgi:7-cyano-7-deazaguanine synthase